MIAVRMLSGKSGCSPRADQCEGKWKALTLAFRKCEDHNSKTGNDRRECPFYKELSEVYGYRPNVRPYATASSSGQGVRSQTMKTRKMTRTVAKPQTSATQTQQGPVQPLRKRPRRNGVSRESETKVIVFRGWRIMREEKRKEQEDQRERADQHHREKMELLSGLLNVFKNLNK